MIGTIVVDERIHPIHHLELAAGAIEVVIRVDGPGHVPRIESGAEYRIHGHDGSLVWRGVILEECGPYDLGDEDAWELHVRSEVTNKLAVELVER